MVTIKRVTDPDEPWRYWRTRPVAERIAMVEQLRREHHGWVDGAEPRLQRIVRVLRRGVDVPVIGRDELRRNKLATGRLRDLADVEDLGPDELSEDRPDSGAD